MLGPCKVHEYVYFYFSSWSSVACSRKRYRSTGTLQIGQSGEPVIAGSPPSGYYSMYTAHPEGLEAIFCVYITFGTEQHRPVPVRGEWRAYLPYKVGCSLRYRWHGFGFTVGWTSWNLTLIHWELLPRMHPSRMHSPCSWGHKYGYSPNWTAVSQINATECMLHVLWGSACTWP